MLRRVIKDLPEWLEEDVKQFNFFLDELRYPHETTKVQEIGEFEGQLLQRLYASLRPNAGG